MIETFIKNLVECSVEFKSPVENIYSPHTIASKNTVNNLRLYLNEMLSRKPKYLIVGEAPGYNGCRWSGIPFTSEAVLVNNPFFNQNYKVRDINKPQKETSATIVWNCLDEMQTYPLMWNAFPFHPYKDKTNSNRAPNSQELKYGSEILQELINIFKIDKENIFAIGKKAEGILSSYESFNSVKYIRHPSNGGKNDFIQGMHKWINS